MRTFYLELLDVICQGYSGIPWKWNCELFCNALWPTKQPIIYLYDDDRPQPKKDRDNDKGMTVTVGRLREDNVFDIKFVALSHNTIRGAAGGAILNAELLKTKGFIN